jgi:hypothetical protein
MKRWLLALLLVLPTLSRAELRTDNNQTSWVMGFAMASIYDVYWYRPGNQNIDMSIDNLLWLKPTYVSQEYFVQNQKTKYVVAKVGIGLLTGAAMSLYNAQKYERSPTWDDVVFGGVGGLTSVVIHF